MADPRAAIEKLLDSLGESAQFVTSGSLTPVLPGLEVEGVDSIGFPISAADAKRLIAKATQAPYGRGEETILDTNVRRVWQIEPSQFALRNEAWNLYVAAIVDAVKREFGISQKVNPELYKLLVYEKGSFFAPHRDSEKTTGMFATLVVCLPSRHEGGTLIVKHDGQTKKIDFGGKDAEFHTQYAAFYADCQHEITPVTAGYRICLVYNLAIAGKNKKQPSAPRNASAVEGAARLLKTLFADPSGEPDRIVIPFKHQYTEAGFDPKQLKGSDRARADVLVRAAESLDYQCYLALLTHHESGEPDYSTMDYDRYSYRRRGWSYGEDEEDEEMDESGVEMGDVYEEEWSLDHWLDPQGHKQSFGEMHLEGDEILSQNGSAGWVYKQELHEATGNAGVSMDRWYRQGVIVIWPRYRYFSILAGEGPASAIPALEKMAGRSKKPAALEDCRRFAKEIIGHWESRQSIPEGGLSYPERMLKLLDRIGTAELVQSFLRNALPKDYSGSEGKALCRLFQKFGWEPFGAAVREFLAQQKPENYLARLEAVVSICKSLCSEPPAMTEERRAVCASLADELLRVIDRWDKQPANAWYDSRGARRTGVVEGVIRFLSSIPATEQLERFLAHVLADTKHYDLHATLIPDVKAIYHWVSTVPAAQPAASRLLQHCLTELRAATAHPIEPPKDWTREAKLGCKCEDCQALSRFLRNPTERVGRFSIRKERRQHLHQQIERHRCDATHVTERKGSPQTLVCTKTQASYERRLNQFNVDKSLLAELESLAESGQSVSIRKATDRRSPKSKR